MNTLKRVAGLFGAALFLAVFLTSAMEPPKCAHATCGTTWHIWAESSDRQVSHSSGGKTTETNDWVSRSVQVSDDGQTSTDHQEFHKYADGSSEEHEETSHEDKYGNGCGGDGEPWSGGRKRDVKTDAEGNSEEHIEEIIEKDGKCMKWVRDRAWDRNGKPIKDTGWIETEIPCKTEYNLEYTLEGEGTSNMSDLGPVTMRWGPDTAVIPLSLKDGVYTGTYEGNFTATYSGGCSGTQTYPTTIEVKAQEDELRDLKFSVSITNNMMGMVTCAGSTAPQSNEPNTTTRTFTLEFAEGATHVEDIPAGIFHWKETFVLKKR
jgi:hypothetical protein